MRIRRVVLGASIVGVVGAAAALTVAAVGPQAESDSVASPAPGASTSVAVATVPETVPVDTEQPATEPPNTEPPNTAPPDTGVADAETLDTIAPTTIAPTTVAPPTTAVAEPTFEFADASTCPATGRAAVVDRENQRAWLCGDGLVTLEMPMTSAWIQPDPGDYAIYAKDMNSSSRFTGQYSTMTHFVAFTHGKIRGARIAFHSMPIYSDGSFVQPLETLGALDQRGNSAGCIRVSPADAELIWAWLEIGDLVRVVS
jgi:hypothetical protein